MGRCFRTYASNTDDPPEVRNWRVTSVALVVSMSSLAMGYATSVAGGTMALDSFVRDFNMDMQDSTARDTMQASIVWTFQIGCLCGGLLTFPIAERFGRKRSIIWTAPVFILGSALSTAAAGSIGIVYAGRLIAGLGIGASSTVVPVYLSEIAPPSIRGRLSGIMSIASQFGGMLAFWINYSTDQTIDGELAAQWMLPFAIQLVPGVGLLVGTLFCPESPRWLARRNDWKAAETVLINLRGLSADHEYIRSEMSSIRDQIELRSVNQLSAKAQVRKMLQKGTRNRLGIGLALMFLTSFTGVNTVTYYAPRIFESLGIGDTSTRLFSTGFYGIAKTSGVIMFTYLVVERLGRRDGLLWGAFLGCLPLWYIGVYVKVADPTAAAAAGTINRDGWGYMAVLCVYVNGIIICATWQGIAWTYASEIFPLDIRMLCVALTTAVTRLSSFIIAISTPYMISALGYGAYFFFAVLLCLMGIWAFFFVAETKGRSLEEMDALFADSVHGVVWAQIRGRKLEPSTWSNSYVVEEDKRSVSDIEGGEASASHVETSYKA